MKRTLYVLRKRTLYAFIILFKSAMTNELWKIELKKKNFNFRRE